MKDNSVLEGTAAHTALGKPNPAASPVSATEELLDSAMHEIASGHRNRDYFRYEFTRSVIESTLRRVKAGQEEEERKESLEEPGAELATTHVLQNALNALSSLAITYRINPRDGNYHLCRICDSEQPETLSGPMPHRATCAIWLITKLLSEHRGGSPGSESPQTPPSPQVEQVSAVQESFGDEALTPSTQNTRPPQK